MKVLYIHHNPDKGGSAYSLRYLLEELPKDIDVHVCSPRGEAFEGFKKVTNQLYPTSVPPILCTISGVKLIWLRLLLELPKIRRYNKEIEKILDKVKPDIVHLNEIALVSVAAFCKWKGYKVVMHARVVADHRYKWITCYVSRIINRSVDQTICIDGSVSHVLPKVKRKTIVYNPLKINEVVPRKKTNETLNVFFLASFLKQKGIFDVLRTAIYLKDDPTIHFLIAGGNIKDTTFYKSPIGILLHVTRVYPNIQKIIEDSIRTNSLTNITLLGYVDNINEKLIDSDVLLLPTRMNEPSRSVFEAGIFGVPTIITLRDKIEDLVEDNVTGIILNEGDIKGIGCALKRLKKDSVLLKRMGESAKERYSILNNRSTSVSRVYAIYKSLHFDEKEVLRAQ